MAIHRPRPTRISPVLNPGWSGRQAQASASCLFLCMLAGFHKTRQALYRLFRRAYHEEWSYDPIYNDTESDLLPDATMREYYVKRLVPDLAENRVHHDEQSNSFRNS
jgi:hypothetical protein